MNALFKAINSQGSPYISPIESELNRHFEGIDREDAEQAWRDMQLHTVTDYKRHFSGKLDEFIWMLRAGDYEGASALLKEADDRFIQMIKDNPEF